jgi:hypothetical protein
LNFNLPGAKALQPVRRGVLLAGVVLVCALAAPFAASADTAPIPSTPDLPWADPAHQSSFELLASRIASHIAGRPVAVRCEGDDDWETVVRKTGGNPSSESGYVGTTWNGATGQLVGVSDMAELAGGDVCLPLNRFAVATAKPTQCSAPAAARTTLTAVKRVRAAAVGSGATRNVKAVEQRRVPCYLGEGKSARPMPASYWRAYGDYAVAILILAHESIHLGGVAGGRLANGLPVGDQQAEAKADCFGMQAMRYVAEQLGDTPEDAQSIAVYFWDVIYPRAVGSSYSEYWSADCRPGGPLDTRPAGSIAWP